MKREFKKCKFKDDLKKLVFSRSVFFVTFIAFILVGKLDFFHIIKLPSLIKTAYAYETTYSSGSGTFNVPAGTTTLIIELWGGGGAAGDVDSSTNGTGGGGGGGGGYAKSTITSPSINSSYSYFVGAGGTSFGNGEGSTIDTNLIVGYGGNAGTAGSGGVGGNGGSGGGGTGDVIYTGGSGADGTTSTGGGGGGGAGSSANGSNASGTTGGAGGTGNTDGTGGDGGSGNNATGITGSAWGGGGGAGTGKNGASADGASGYIIFTYYGVPTVTTQAVTNIDYETATANGNITSTGDRDVTERGFAYMTGTTGDPTIASSTVAETGTFSTGSYTGSLTGLSAGTDYRVRSFAVNEEGLSYGSTVQLTTLSYPSVDLSGIIYQSDGTTPYDCSSNNLTVYLKLDGSGSHSATCTQNTGAWSVNGITLMTGNPVIYAYIYGETVKGSTVFYSDSTNQNNLPIIQNRVVLRDDVDGSITNSEILSGNTSDSDDLVSFSGSDITVGSSYTTQIYSGDTYSPGANVTTGKLLVTGNYSGSTETLTLTGSGTSTSRPLYVNGGTFTAPTNVVYKGTSVTTIENTPYNNLSFTPTITGATTYTFLSSGSVSGNLTINPTAASSNTLTVNLAGTLTVAPSGTITITGTTSGLSLLNTVSGSNHTISAGKIDVQSAGTLTANASNIYLTGTSATIFTRTGTFNQGTSEVFFQQTSGSTTLTSGAVTFYDMTVNMSGRTGSAGNNVTVGGGLTVSAGEFSVPSTYTLSVTGNTSITGSLTISSSGNQTFTGTVTINSGGTFTRSSASGTNLFVGKLAISGGGTFTTSNNPAFTLRGGLSNSGTFASGTGTYTFNTNSQSLEGTAATTFGGTVAISGSITLQNSNTNTVTINGNLTGTVAGSTYQNNANATTNFKGAVLSTGTLTATANPNTIIYSGNAAQSIKATNYHNLILTPTITAARTYTFLGSTSVAGDLTINPTASSAYTLTVNLGGTLTVANSGTLTITGTSSGSSLLDTVSGSNYGITVGNVTIGSSGTLNGRASTISVRGNWNNSSTYTYNTSTVNFEGSGAQQILGDTTFYNLSITTSSPRTITFQAGSTTSVASNGFLTLEGLIGNLLTLQSSVEGSDWYLQVSTTGTSHSVSYVSVSDSNASGYTEIDASDKTSWDEGGNTNWLWPPPEYRFGLEGLEVTGVTVY